MLAQVGDTPAGGQDLLRERRERAQSRVSSRRTQQAGAQVERHSVSIVHDRESVWRFKYGDPEVDAVAKEDPREALRDDPADAELRECRDGVFAGAPTTEILAPHEDVAWLHLLGKTRPRIAERVRVELVLADHERRVASRDDLISVEVVAKNPGSTQSSISAATPIRAAATMSSRERSPERTEAAPRPARSERRRATSSSNPSSVASRYGRGSSMTPVSAATAATYGEPMKIDASGEPIRPR